MIFLMSYWFWLCWGMDTDKFIFATLSTFEFGVELAILLIWMLIFKPWRRS